MEGQYPQNNNSNNNNNSSSNNNANNTLNYRAGFITKIHLYYGRLQDMEVFMLYFHLQDSAKIRLFGKLQMLSVQT